MLVLHLVYRGHGATAGLGEAAVPRRGLGLPAARAPHQAPGDRGGPHLAGPGQRGQDVGGHGQRPGGGPGLLAGIK